MSKSEPRDAKSRAARKPREIEPTSKRLSIQRGDERIEFRDRLPLLPLRDVVVFPHTMARFVIGRPASVLALEAALSGDRLIFLATQHDATVDVD